MNTINNEVGTTTGFLTTGDVLVDDLMRCLNQSGRNSIENFQALARVVMWCSLPDFSEETSEMSSARELLRNGALMFDRAVKQARIKADDK